jgi:hypothetical protein
LVLKDGGLSPHKQENKDMMSEDIILLFTLLTKKNTD